MTAIASEDSDVDDLEFDWEVTGFTKYNLNFQLKFKKPLSVSSSGPQRDKLKISFNNSLFFYDEDDLILPEDTTIEYSIPA